MNRPSLLVVDDEDSLLITYRSILKHAYDITPASSGKEALDLLENNKYDLMLLDIMLGDSNGLDILKKSKERDSQLAVIMVTAVRDVRDAVVAMKSGAYDYLTKPFEADEILTVVAKALEHRELIKENRYLRQTLQEKESYLELIGKSAIMQEVYTLIDKVAATTSTVLITGESGTGKELVARAIHKKSPRANQPFVVVNCAAIPENLFESELFGHARASFTGAIEDRLGKFELADGGTIFLDEIGCMPPTMQAKLLRVIQDNLVEKVGSSKPVKVDTRIIAATNLPIEEAVEKGLFRKDLFYRLNVIRINLPPLRDRKEDISPLANYFLVQFNLELNRKIKGFTEGSITLLTRYNWPGNVRELQNMVERAVTLAGESDYITSESFPLQNERQGLNSTSLKDAGVEFETNYINAVLQKTNGNQTKAADLLGINRTTLIAKMKQLGLN
ncbi:MAG: sigma-54 dependent transcriptional regulator [Candidatus Margulisiibacteriota bacterium]